MEHLGDSAPTVSAVIATYNQPLKLLAAIKSVLLQTFPVHSIIVVGDACSNDTGTTLNQLDLPHLRFFNLPFRCGEQAIPNAVGTVLAQTEFVAYLNHDDLWLPNHLSHAFDNMKVDGRDWFVGAAAFCEQLQRRGSDEVPVFGSRTKPDRTVAQSYSMSHLSLEPASSWVVQRNLVLRVGNWKPAWQIGRTPVAELPLRLLRDVGEPATGKTITVAKILAERAALPGPHYFQPASGYDFLLRALDRGGRSWPNFFTWPTEVAQDRYKRDDDALPRLKQHDRIRELFDGLALSLFKLSGIDFLESVYRLRRGKGAVLRGALWSRTGETNLARTTLRSALSQVLGKAQSEHQ